MRVLRYNGVADRAAVIDVDFRFRAQPPLRLSNLLAGSVGFGRIAIPRHSPQIHSKFFFSFVPDSRPRHPTRLPDTGIRRVFYGAHLSDSPFKCPEGEASSPVDATLRYSKTPLNPGPDIL